MSRLNFRALDIKNKKFFDDFLIDKNGELCFYTDTEQLIYLNENEYILMQSTGLKDCNGVEIFEGDVVKIYYYYDDINELKDPVSTSKVKEYGEVDMLFCEYDSSLLKWIYNEDNIKKIEVIGNIYQNKELIKD